MTYTTTGSAIRQTAIQTTGIPASEPGRSQPSGGWPGGSSSRIGSSAAGGVASGPNPSAPPAANRAHTTSEPRASAMAIRSGVTDSEPSGDRAVQPAGRQRAEEHEATEHDRRADAEAHLLVRPGDRVEHRHDDRQQGEADHDREEGQVAEARVRRSGAMGTLMAM